jgi:hypothetical protein
MARAMVNDLMPFQGFQNKRSSLPRGSGDCLGFMGVA